MSPARTWRRSSGARSRTLSIGHGRRVPGGADALGHVMLIDALDRLLAGRIERCHDDAVGIAEAGAELAEEIVHARVAMRLEHGDDAPARAGTRRRRARRRSRSDDAHSRRRSRHRSKSPVSSKRRLTPVKLARAERMASSVMPASLAAAMAASALSALCWPGRGTVQPRICRSPPRTRGPRSASMTMPPRSCVSPRQHEVGATRGAVGQQAAPVAAQLAAARSCRAPPGGRCR